MEAFVNKILPSLLITVIMTSCVVTKSVHTDIKDDNKGRPLSTKNCTEENCREDVTRRSEPCVQYVLDGRNQQCYLKFFVKKKPPIGFRPVKPANKLNDPIRYICQPPRICGQQDDKYFYATMFDEDLGIAVFSAYFLTEEMVDFDNYKPRHEHPWYPTPGIRKQGSLAMYRDQVQYDRGHLVPSKTYSSSQERRDSTFTYTNAVPQDSSWNSGFWSTFEDRIRQYARKTCTKLPGTLYLLTGTSFARIQKEDGNLRVFPNLPVKPLQQIAIPNSLWTAGCCVRHEGISESFAVMGNNVWNFNRESLTLQINVAALQIILTADVTNHQIGGPEVDLFPGDPNCAKNDMGNLPPPARRKKLKKTM